MPIWMTCSARCGKGNEMMSISRRPGSRGAAMASLLVACAALLSWSTQLGAAQAATAAAGPLPAKVAEVEGISEYRLDNGLRVLLFPDQSKPTITVNVTYLVGSRHENYGETGMAHLLEHMLFKGTKNRPEIGKEF